MNLELEFLLHEDAEPFFTVKALVLPKGKDLRFALFDNKDELFTAEEFKAKLKTVHFKQTWDFCFYLVDGRKGLVRIPLRAWPVSSSGYGIRSFKFSCTLGLNQKTE
jgi:hypothetical protein